MSTSQVPPVTDSGLLEWAQGFSSLIGATPAAFEVLPATATELTGLFGAYQTALANSTGTTTRGPATILQKNLAKTALLDLCRPLANQINSNPNITDVQRQALGLRIRSTHNTPIPVPTETPEMDILSVTGRTVKARLHGETLEHRRKPENCVGAFIWTFAGEIPAEELSDWTFWGQVTKTTFEVEFPVSVEQGSKVWLAAGWVNAKGQVGPVCDPKSTYTQMGGVTLAMTSAKKKAA